MRLTLFRKCVLGLTANLLGLCLCLLVSLECVEITLRYGFSTTIAWAADVSGLLLLILGWLGAGHLWIARGHLVVDLFQDRFPLFFRYVNTTIDAVVLLGIIWLAPKLLVTISIYSDMIMPALDVSASVRFIPLVIGFFLISLGSAINLLEAALGSTSRA